MHCVSRREEGGGGVAEATFVVCDQREPVPCFGAFTRCRHSSLSPSASVA
jgi:hypothetical protein